MTQSMPTTVSLGDGNLQRVRRGRGHLLACISDARDLLARRFLGEEGRRQAQVRRENVDTNGLHHVASDVGDAVVGGVGSDAAHRENRDDPDRHPEDRVRVLLNEDLVDQGLEQAREQGQARRVDDHAEYGDETGRTEALRVTKQALVGLPGLGVPDRDFFLAH